MVAAGAALTGGQAAADIYVGAFGIRAEYETFDLKASEVDDLYMRSIGVEYHFQ